MVLVAIGQAGDERAERQRAGVAHEDARRRGVPPQEADQRAGRGAGDQRHLQGVTHLVAVVGVVRPGRRTSAGTARTRSPCKLPITRMDVPVARPSRPSVRLTALDIAMTTKTKKMTAPILVMLSQSMSWTHDSFGLAPW